MHETPQLSATLELQNVLRPPYDAHREPILLRSTLAPWEIGNAGRILFSPYLDIEVPKPAIEPLRDSPEELAFLALKRQASLVTLKRLRMGGSPPAPPPVGCLRSPKPERPSRRILFADLPPGSLGPLPAPVADRPIVAFHTEAWCDASVDHGGPSAGAALFFRSGSTRPPRLMTCRCGFDTCSYRAEALTIEAALIDILRPLSLAQHRKRFFGRRYLVVTDSQSVIRALQTGPLSQTGDTENRIWVLLMRLADLGVWVTLQFVYSHCGVTRNEAVDVAAKAAVAQPHPGLDTTPVWLTDLSRRVKARIRMQRKASLSLTTHRESIVPPIPQVLSAVLPRDVAVRFARLRTGETLELGIFPRRMNVFQTMACRWCCADVHERLAPPPPPPPANTLKVVSTERQLCPECTDGYTAGDVGKLRTHYKKKHDGVPLPERYVARARTAPAPRGKLAPPAAPAPSTPKVPILSTCPHCNLQKPKAHHALCPQRITPLLVPVIPNNLRSGVDGPDETISHLFSACTGSGIVRLRSEMPDVFEHPLGYLLESNNALLLKFLDAAHAILVSPGRFAFLGSIDPPAPAPPPGQHDDDMQFS